MVSCRSRPVEIEIPFVKDQCGGWWMTENMDGLAFRNNLKYILFIKANLSIGVPFYSFNKIKKCQKWYI